MKYTKQLHFGFDEAEPTYRPSDKPTAPRARVASLPDRLINMREVMDLTGLSRRMIYRLIAQGRFPRQFKPGGYASRWSVEEVRNWVRGSRS